MTHAGPPGGMSARVIKTGLRMSSNKRLLMPLSAQLRGLHVAELTVVCSDPHEEFGGLNCLIERESVDATASKFGLSVEETETTLAKARQLLHERRAQRPRPHLDDKVMSFVCISPK